MKRRFHVVASRVTSSIIIDPKSHIYHIYNSDSCRAHTVCVYAKNPQAVLIPAQNPPPNCRENCREIFAERWIILRNNILRIIIRERWANSSFSTHTSSPRTSLQPPPWVLASGSLHPLASQRIHDAIPADSR